LVFSIQKLKTAHGWGANAVRSHVSISASPFPVRRAYDLLQFDDVRRKTKFIAAKIVPNTSNRGITPGPKLMASPIIHNKTASVKIVQNTTLLLNG
jgi:hypothetical protein